MKNYRVVFTPDAESDLIAIYDYIAVEKGMPEVAWAYIQKLRASCHALTNAPIRGRERNDLRLGLRVLSLTKNTIAAFEVNETEQIVTILNLFHGGKDYDAIMKDNVL